MPNPKLLKQNIFLSLLIASEPCFEMLTQIPYCLKVRGELRALITQSSLELLITELHYDFVGTEYEPLL